MGHAGARSRSSHFGSYRPCVTRRQWSVMSILIITHSDDNESVTRVIEAIARKGGHTIRFDTDRYPTDVRLTAYYGSGGDERLTLTNEEGEFDLREVDSIWHRRLSF